MNTGYREMLRDRVPRTVDLALKWCKAKERWLDHAYYSFVNIYSNKGDRYEAAKIVLGRKKKVQTCFCFHDTIDWDNLSKDEELYWKTVEAWVNWFRSNMLAIEAACTLSNNLGKSREYIENEIKLSYCIDCAQDIQDKLSKYLVKSVFGE